jgi:polysaccharide export outer membrane protein
MFRQSRGLGGAALACWILSIGATGCLNTQSMSPPAVHTGQGCTSCNKQVSYGPPQGMPQQGMPQGMPQQGGQQSGVKQVSFQTQEGVFVENGGAVASVGVPNPGPIPTELQKTSLPPHRVAPPDILFIESLRIVPKGPYRLEPLEVLQIVVSDTLPNQPINGNFLLTPEGTVNLGYNYGSVRVGGMTIEQAQTAMRNHLGNILRNPTVNVGLAQFRGLQNIRGEHLVRPDGTIGLGSYGSVYVAGLALGQVKCVIEKHLSEYLVNPQVSVDVFAYNSRRYYIVVDGGGFGQQVFTLPHTGNETVLDAISQVQGLAPVSSKKKIWVARPSPASAGCNIVMPVDWEAITMGGSTGTNYQLFPGDRIYVSADPLITFDNYLSKLLAPVERIIGVTLLGTNLSNSFRFNRNGNNGGFIVVP